LNLYTYCHNSPLGCVDPTGHMGQSQVVQMPEKLEAREDFVADFTNAALAVPYESAAVSTATSVSNIFKSAWGKLFGKAGGELFRRSKNIGAFKDLAVPMQLKEVEAIASEAGIGLEGIKVRIVRDPELVGKGLYGWADPKGKVIELYPDAFTDTENLVKTLGHERTHIYQTKTFGPPDVDTIMDYENGAYGSEESWWQYYQMNGR